MKLLTFQANSSNEKLELIDPDGYTFEFHGATKQKLEKTFGMPENGRSNVIVEITEHEWDKFARSSFRGTLKESAVKIR